MELLCVVAVMGIVFTAGVPRLAVGFENARTDEAGAMLRSLWNAERMYWLEHRTFTADIDALIGPGFLDQAVKVASDPFSYEITSADDEGFTAQATRAGSASWTGTLQIDESGAITGEIEDEHGDSVQPYQG
jgi:type II secretory pathway pseudopilin PulG